MAYKLSPSILKASGLRSRSNRSLVVRVRGVHFDPTKPEILDLGFRFRVSGRWVWRSVLVGANGTRNEHESRIVQWFMV